MAMFCKKCGRGMKDTDLFCTGCGTRVEPVQAAAPEISTRIEKKQFPVQMNKTLLISLISIVGIAVVAIAAYFIVNSIKDSKQEAAPTVSISKSEDAPTAKSEESASADDEEAVINNYTRKLNALKIHTSGQDISVGRWSITNQNGKLLLVANHIPSKDLARIFDLYDAGNMNPLDTWAKEVFYIAEDLSRELDAEWSIGVGNECVPEYPATLASADIMAYSGTCGYSIPVLSGEHKDNLSLIVSSGVFGSSNTKIQSPLAAVSTEFIFPDSDIRRLTESEIAVLTLEELRMARNEIYARHGYIFNSDDLRFYFSKKSWYYPDASYDGKTLNQVEKYNVELIQSRERYLK